MSAQEALPDDALVIVAIAVSRVEALVMASMLRSAGIIVHIDGDQHASVEIISLALGGHRLRVPAWQWSDASSVIREAGLQGTWRFCESTRQAILRLIAAYAGPFLAMIGWGIITDRMPVWTAVFVPLTVAGIPVNPQGPTDFFLAPESD